MGADDLDLLKKGFCIMLCQVCCPPHSIPTALHNGIIITTKFGVDY